MSDWIFVDERLPETESWVWVVDADGGMEPAKFMPVNEYGWGGWMDYLGFIMNGSNLPVAWQPLPEPPTEEQIAAHLARQEGET